MDDSSRTTFLVMAPWVEEWGRHRYTVAFDFTYNSVGEVTRTAGRLSAMVEDLEESNRVLNGLNTELQDPDRVKSDLLANVSHELRTPLTSIRGYGEAVRGWSNLTGSAKLAQGFLLSPPDSLQRHRPIYHSPDGGDLG